MRQESRKAKMDSRSPAPESSPWLPFESRRRARDAKRDAVLRAAVQLFLEQGYHRATLNDVAERLNITKPALYNYFRSKDEILFECWSLGRERVGEVIAGIDAEGGTGLVRLRKLVHAYAAVMATDFGASLVRFDPRDLAAKNAAIVRAGKREIDRTFRDYIAAGVADGSIRRCDVKLTAFAIAGALNWIGHWYRHDGALSAQAIADDFALRLTSPLATARGRAASMQKNKQNKSRALAASARPATKAGRKRAGTGTR